LGRLETVGAGLAGNAAAALRGYRTLNRKNATNSRAPLKQECGNDANTKIMHE